MIFGGKRCDKKGHWGADNVLLLDLSGVYANPTCFIMAWFLGISEAHFSVCMLLNGF